VALTIFGDLFHMTQQMYSRLHASASQYWPVAGYVTEW